MSVLGDFHFLRPLWLLLVPVAFVLWRVRRRALDPLWGWRFVMERELIEAFTVGQETRDRYRGALLLVGWILAIIAVAGPTWRPEPSPFSDDPVPVMLALRADKSMDSSDLAPSRMERARLKIADFAALRQAPTGLLAYAGSSHLVLPPTRDASVVQSMAAEIGPAIMPRPGNDLAGALRLAAKALGAAGGSILVVLDTAEPIDEGALRAFREEHRRLPIYFHAIARPDTPELDAVERAASLLGADVTQLTAESTDVERLVARAASAPRSVSVDGGNTRWAEAGWWIVPLLALLMLTRFRREMRVNEEVNS